MAIRAAHIVLDLHLLNWGFGERCTYESLHNFTQTVNVSTDRLAKI